MVRMALSSVSRRYGVALAAAFALCAPPVLSQSADLPEPTSPAPAKVVVGLLQAHKLEAFAAKDPSAAGRFVAVLSIPEVQLLVVSATYERPTDIEYRIYQKDFMGAYMDLSASRLAKDRVFVEDVVADGLQPIPAKDGPGDSFTLDAERRTFDGVFSKKPNDKKKIWREDYIKAFSGADATYTRLLAVLADALKTPAPPLGSATRMR
jgi:hypothetical protein